MAVKPVGDALALVMRVSHHHRITLVKVDLEPQHLLKAKEEELQMEMSVSEPSTIFMVSLAYWMTGYSF